MSEFTLKLTFDADGNGLVGFVETADGKVGHFEQTLKRVDRGGKQAGQSVDKFGRDSRQAASGVNSLDKATDRLARNLVATAAVYFSLSSAKNLVADFRVQEQAVAALDASIASMHRTTAGLSTQLQTLASQIQGEGIIGDEAIIQGQSFLTTYSTITDDLLPRATRLMVDLAAKMGGDVVAAANMVGKASMGMVGELARTGITFSDAAKESKDFMLIMEEMEAQVSGMNAALAATDTGGIDQFGNALGDVREQLGEIITIGVSDYMRSAASEMALTDETVQSLGSGLNSLIGHLDEAAIGIGGLLLARTAGPVMGALSVNAVYAAQAMHVMGASATVNAIKVDLLAASATAARGALAILGGPAGLLIAAATGVAIWASSSRDAEAATRDWNRELLELQGNQEQIAVNDLQQRIASLTAEIQTARGELNYSGGLFGQSYDEFLAKVREIETGEQLLKALQEQLTKAQQKLDAVGASGKGAAEGVGDHDKELTKLVANLKEEYATLGKDEAALLRYKTAQATAGKESSDLAKEAKSLTEKIIAKNAALEKTKAAQDKAAKATKEAAEHTKAAERAYRDEIEALADQHAKLTLTEREYYRYTLVKREFTEVEIDAAMRIWDTNQALEAQQAAAADAAKNMQTASQQMAASGNWIDDLTSRAFDGFDSIEEAFKSMLKNMLATALANQIKIALGFNTSGMGGGGFSLSGLGDFISNPLGSIQNFMSNPLDSLSGLFGGGINLGAAQTAASYGVNPGTQLALAEGSYGPSAGLGASIGAGAAIAIASYAINGIISSITRDVGWGAQDIGTNTVTDLHGDDTDSISQIQTLFSDFAGSLQGLSAGDIPLQIYLNSNSSRGWSMAVDSYDESGTVTPVISNDAIAGIPLFNEDQPDWLQTNGPAHTVLDYERYADPEEMINAGMNAIFDSWADSAEGLSQAMIDAVKAAESLDEKLALTQAWFTAMDSIDQYLDTDPIEAYYSALENQSETLWDTLTPTHEAVLSVANAFDGTIESAQALAVATAQASELHLALAAQIHQVSLAIDETIGSTVQSIRESIMSEDELYEARRTQAHELAADLETMTDPARIQETIQAIDELTNQMYFSLDDTQMAEVNQEFIDFLEQVAETGRQRLMDAQTALGDEVQQNQGEIADIIAAALQPVTDAQQLTAAELDTATARLDTVVDKLSTAISRIPEEFRILLQSDGLAA